MSKVDASTLWGPSLLAREKLGGRRWCFVIEAPFDMHAAEVANLIGTAVCVDGLSWTIRGIVPNMPQTQIRAGQPIELLVAAGF